MCTYIHHVAYIIHHVFTHAHSRIVPASPTPHALNHTKPKTAIHAKVPSKQKNEKRNRLFAQTVKQTVAKQPRHPVETIKGPTKSNKQKQNNIVTENKENNTTPA